MLLTIKIKLPGNQSHQMLLSTLIALD